MRLTDCFIQLIAYVAYFLKTVGKKQPPFEQVKADIQRLLSQSEEFLKQNIIARDEFDMGRFAVCAWVDEAILNSSWKEKDKWQREPLQFIFYNSTDAGEEFFNRLNVLGFHQRDVREVFYLCLAMGFKGRYHFEKDRFLLDQVKASNLKILFGSSLGPPSLDRSELFPEAYVTESVKEEPGKRGPILRPFTLLGIGVPVILFVVLFIIYYFVLNDIAGYYIKMVF